MSVPTPPAAVPEASGRAFLGIIRSVKESHGAAELTAVVAAAGEETRKAFASRIRHSGWYPYAAFAGFLTALEQRLGHGDPGYGRRLGASSGVKDINSIFRIYLAIASPERLIRGCSRVWPSYYRQAGTMEATAWAPELTTLRITGFPAMAPVHCRLMEGWMIATMEALGLGVSESAGETLCTSRGDPHHEFSCTWSRQGR